MSTSSSGRDPEESSWDDLGELPVPAPSYLIY